MRSNEAFVATCAHPVAVILVGADAAVLAEGAAHIQEVKKIVPEPVEATIDELRTTSTGGSGLPMSWAEVGPAPPMGGEMEEIVPDVLMWSRPSEHGLGVK